VVLGGPGRSQLITSNCYLEWVKMRMSFPLNSRLRFFYYGIISCLIFFLYLSGTARQSRKVNTDMSHTDQSAYMHYAKKMAETRYAYVGGRNRMPVYPFLQSLFYERGMPDEVFFQQGKFRNVLLSIVILISVFFIFHTRFSLLTSLPAILITIFTVFIFKAPFFQCELFFYFLNFLAFIGYLKLLDKPNWSLGLFTGLIIGLAHLTKASILPGLILFAGFYLFRIVQKIIQNKASCSNNIAGFNNYLRKPLPLALLLISFFLLIWPYISTSKKVFGHYFYNVNSTFCMWYDSWAEYAKGTRSHGDRIGWPTMPEEEIPSPTKYFKTHSLKQIAFRLKNGAVKTVHKMMSSYGYFKFLLFYTLCAIYLIWKNKRLLKSIYSRYSYQILFSLVFFSTYFLLYAWYVPIASGNRFVLALFLPYLYVVNLVINYPEFQAPSITIRNRSYNCKEILNWIMLMLIIMDIPLILGWRIGSIYGGN